MAKDEIAYLGFDTVYEGKLHFKGTERIEGRYTGANRPAKACSMWARTPRWKACWTGGRAAALRRFSGEVTARRRVVVYSSGLLEGQVCTPSLLTEEGGVIEGQVHMKNPGKPKDA